MQGTEPHNKERLVQNASVAEVEKSCSRGRTGDSEVQEPSESVYEIGVCGFQSEPEAFMAFSKRKNGSETCSVCVGAQSEWLLGL